ncbi:MAG TPA: LysR family transcriptional regulator [Steroidobacteraceae bacterium]
MFDGVSLDQLRTFIAAADEGSFSAAGRRLRRAQSVVSQSLANLEGQLGVKLFNRGARFPTLTDQGRALLADARAVAGNIDLFKARAKRLAGGLEPELSVAVDVVFPLAPFTAAVAAFQKEFPSTLLRFDVESSAVIEPVLDGRCAVGVMASSQVAPPQLTRERLLTITAPAVVSPQHPLATYGGPIPMGVLAEHIQLVHADPSDLSRAGGFGLLSPRVWRLSHLGAKHAFLRAGLGFGVMPLHMIEADLASGALVQISADSAPSEGYLIAMSAVYRTDSPPGPAGRWFIDRLKHEDAQWLQQKTPLSEDATVKRERPSRRSLTVVRPLSGNGLPAVNQ